MSKPTSAAITVTVTQTPISWRRLGSVMEMNSRTGPAPSSLGGLVERRVDLAHAGEQQHGAEAEQHPRADHADRGQRGAEVAQPGPGHAAQARRPEDWLTTPVDDEQPAPRDAGRDQRDDLRQEKHSARQRAPTRAGAIRRIVDATTRPSSTGIALKKMISSKAWLEDTDEIGVGEDRPVVVQADPRRGPMPSHW